ncbi:flagellar biosynthesis protein FliQ [Flintibacter faecis]|uniref:Flagellar biosynthetic protein FliQ n=1 Tax=Flintibacter faecis TaxID=2763047 RepID=A0A8J6M230_9FIRM|nr:flagellar biosynthesis protein FliQ [Flintibacter faecis]MBC5717974.1 flagellar biosynthesis protein FliQ [Flintibacter faecis]
MDTTTVIDVLREAVSVALELGGPMLILSMLVGVVIAIFQAVTQIHEQTISFMLKLIVVILVLLIGGSWMLTTLQDYTKEIFALIAA